MIEVDGPRKHFGLIEAVRGVSFRADKGEVLGFLGPNGAGKTTTMRMITGFLPPSAGTARVCGHDVGTDAMRSTRDKVVQAVEEESDDKKEEE
jgi:ABC-2 type transport system ATP-binding protein